MNPDFLRGRQLVHSPLSQPVISPIRGTDYSFYITNQCNLNANQRLCCSDLFMLMLAWFSNTELWYFFGFWMSRFIRPDHYITFSVYLLNDLIKQMNWRFLLQKSKLINWIAIDRTQNWVRLQWHEEIYNSFDICVVHRRHLPIH